LFGSCDVEKTLNLVRNSTQALMSSKHLHFIASRHGVKFKYLSIITFMLHIYISVVSAYLVCVGDNTALNKYHKNEF